MKNTLFLILLALLFVACGNDSSTSASDDNISSKSSSSNRHSGLDSESSSSRKKVSSSSNRVSELVDPADVIVGSMTDSRDGQTYKTVKIGTQVWMAQNLNYETAGSYCYNDTGHTCSLPSGNIQGACPAGWHLPTETEWETLFTAVGGQLTAGKVLKSTLGWNSRGDGTSGNGTDAFSFSALPAGSWVAYTEGYVGGYDDEGYATFFWSPAEYDSNHAYYMNLYYLDDFMYLDFMRKNCGISVRCLKD